jgi:hypothetical protein
MDSSNFSKSSQDNQVVYTDKDYSQVLEKLPPEFDDWLDRHPEYSSYGRKQTFKRSGNTPTEMFDCLMQEIWLEFGSTSGSAEETSTDKAITAAPAPSLEPETDELSDNESSPIPKVEQGAETVTDGLPETAGLDSDERTEYGPTGMAIDSDATQRKELLDRLWFSKRLAV